MKRKKTMVPHTKLQPEMSTHHRIPVAQGGRHGPVSRVTKKRHQAWHTLFDGTLKPEDIAAIINTIWLDPRYYFEVKRKRGP